MLWMPPNNPPDRPGPPALCVSNHSTTNIRTIAAASMEVALVGVGMTPMIRPELPVPPRARCGPIFAPQWGQTLVPRGFSARHSGHIRCEVSNFCSVVPKEDSHHFFSLWNLNQMFRGSCISTGSFGRKEINAYYIPPACQPNTIFADSSRSGIHRLPQRYIARPVILR